MSTAQNHIKRSHRSQKNHYMAGMAQYKIRVESDQRKNSSLPALLAKIYRRGRETKSDI